jgi:hypothetical protein
MQDDDMRAILVETITTRKENAIYYSVKYPEARMGSSVGDAVLAKLQDVLTHKGISLPPSFLQFLRVCNGIESYMPTYELSLRSAESLIASVESGCDSGWKDFAPLHELVFASGDTSAFIAFDREQCDDNGEMMVVLVGTDGLRTEWDNFEQFLVEQLDYERSLLRGNKADRSNLRDD